MSRKQIGGGTVGNEIRMTDEDLKTCVLMIAVLSGLGLEKTIQYLELYYHVRRAYELTADDRKTEQTEPEAEREDPVPEQEEPKAEQKEPGPAAKAAKFKQETRERMQEIRSRRDISIKALADLSGVSDNQILMIMESKPVPVAVYRQISEALDKLEEE